MFDFKEKLSFYELQTFRSEKKKTAADSKSELIVNRPIFIRVTRS